jgi:hypothetical protein
MIDSDNKLDSVFRPFEGIWLATNPSGAITCAKTINGKLLIPYSFGGEGKLTGHYYDCQASNGSLHCRFEHFDSALAGVMFLSTGPNETLKGGRWTNDRILDDVRQDFSRWNESLPGMQPVVWVRVLKTEIPHWAEKYFHEDWPNKA